MTKAVTAIFDSERSHIYQSTHEFVYSISNLIMPLFDFTPLYEFSFFMKFREKQCLFRVQEKNWA